MLLPVFLQLLVATVVVSAPTQSIQRRDDAPLAPPTPDPLLENAPFPSSPCLVIPYLVSISQFLAVKLLTRPCSNHSRYRSPAPGYRTKRHSLSHLQHPSCSDDSSSLTYLTPLPLTLGSSAHRRHKSSGLRRAGE